MYRFDEPLKEGTILKRNSRFSMDVLMNGEVIRCHCPTTGKIGDMEMKNIACLISHSKNINRKLPYTVEAISSDSLDISYKRYQSNPIKQINRTFLRVWTIKKYDFK